ncbi:type III-B CRISPR module RAMP protein Cmr1 [Paenibacillus sp. YYML68]|uniref:type III-B CRISPR module RAMP protein Cmr1 n=1 Tax=Paenibacillus sp. YYML68 TaxID=2909250 RepID=UPI0024935AB6|nr:type III-B CRISPR module RAMP protein Cmr1 [Paenibacillus sp. YYML68]
MEKKVECVYGVPNRLEMEGEWNVKRSLNTIHSDKKQRLLTELAALANGTSATTQDHNHTLERTYQIQLATPMVGGGIAPGNSDLTEPIRATAIRGHLRFWWRATLGAACKDSSELKIKESAIFGDTNQASPWTIKVRLSESPKETQLTPELYPPYIMFPYRDPKKTSAGIQSCSFTLHIILNRPGHSEHWDEIECALWAWINFGGIGARTRRGCGSLYCKTLSPSCHDVPDIRSWIVNSLKRYGARLTPPEEGKEWPTLSTRLGLPSTRSNNNVHSWKELIEKYQLFRKEDHKKRSHWPEPDSIRRITGMSVKKHKESITLSDHDSYAFPRAQLGLPIGIRFHSKDCTISNGDHYSREPYPTTLTPRGADRLASPLILKVLAFSASKGRSIVAVLNQPKINELTLNAIKSKSDNPIHFEKIKTILSRTKISSEHGHIYCSPVYPNRDKQNKNPMKNTTSAVEAFLQFISSSEGGT